MRDKIIQNIIFCIKLKLPEVIHIFNPLAIDNNLRFCASMRSWFANKLKKIFFVIFDPRYKDNNNEIVKLPLYGTQHRILHLCLIWRYFVKVRITSNVPPAPSNLLENLAARRSGVSCLVILSVTSIWVGWESRSVLVNVTAKSQWSERAVYLF